MAESALAWLPRAGSRRLTSGSRGTDWSGSYRGSTVGAISGRSLGTADGQVIEAPPDLASEAARVLAYASFWYSGGEPPHHRGKNRGAQCPPRRLDRATPLAEGGTVSTTPARLPGARTASRGCIADRAHRAGTGAERLSGRPAGVALLDVQRQAQLSGDLVPDHVPLEARLLLILGDSRPPARGFGRWSGSGGVRCGSARRGAQAAALGRRSRSWGGYNARPSTRH